MNWHHQVIVMTVIAMTMQHRAPNNVVPAKREIREILEEGGVRDGDSSVSYNSRQNLRLGSVGTCSDNEEKSSSNLSYTRNCY